MTSFDEIEAAANAKWGHHPLDWPVPPRFIPKWYQLRLRRKLRDLETVFGPLGEAALARWWNESRKGQSVYEDAGGYYARCFAAMAGFAVLDPLATYSGYVGTGEMVLP